MSKLNPRELEEALETSMIEDCGYNPEVEIKSNKRHFSMKNQEYKSGNKKYLDWWDETDRVPTCEKQFYSHLNRWIVKQIGKNMNKSFSDFCRKFPEKIGYINTRDAFRELFKPKHFMQGEIPLYGVDSQNRIISIYKK